MAREASGHANYEVCMLWWPNQLLLVLENERFESGGRSAADPAVGVHPMSNNAKARNDHSKLKNRDFTCVHRSTASTDAG